MLFSHNFNGLFERLNQCFFSTITFINILVYKTVIGTVIVSQSIACSYNFIYVIVFLCIYVYPQFPWRRFVYVELNCSLILSLLFKLSHVC